MPYAMDPRGTLKHRRGGYYVIGMGFAGKHRQVTVARGVAMFALQGEIAEGLQIHHNDQDKLNDLPSNLAICSQEQHRILDELSLLRNHGFDIVERPKEDLHPILKGVIWIGDLLEDREGVLEEVVTWTKNWIFNRDGWITPADDITECVIERRL